MSPQATKTRLPKRLIVACDGTWMNLNSAFPGWTSWFSNKGTLRQPPSNVTRICRAISHESGDGIEQIVYYQAGIGSSNSWTGRLGGLVGSGVTENIREAYEFIANNWVAGVDGQACDEIILLGFSRGAFTARSVAGLIASVGVLTRLGMDDFIPIFSDWENQLDADYTPHWPDDWPSDIPRPHFKDRSYGQELARRHLTRLDVPIKAVGVWDTVGSLGVPDIGPFSFRKELAFVDTEVSPNVSFAFQALGLDEKRRPYLPTVWQVPKSQNNLQLLKQCWFAGVHSNIGSGYEDSELADLTLAWMIGQLEDNGILSFMPEFCIKQHENLIKYYRTQKPPLPVRSWGLGRIYDSFSLLFWPAGEAVRTPGRMHETDPKTGEFTSTRLKDTNETIHPSVRIRLALHGDGPEGDGKKPWSPEALKGWKLVPPEAGKGQRRVAGPKVSKSEDRYRWVSQDGGDDVEITEEKLCGIEIELLKASPRVYEKFAHTLL